MIHLSSRHQAHKQLCKSALAAPLKCTIMCIRHPRSAARRVQLSLAF